MLASSTQRPLKSIRRVLGRGRWLRTGILPRGISGFTSMKVAFQGNTTRPQEERDYRRRFGTTRGMSVPSESSRSVPVIRPRVKASTVSITTTISDPKRNLKVESCYRSLLSKPISGFLGIIHLLPKPTREYLLILRFTTCDIRFQRENTTCVYPPYNALSGTSVIFSTPTNVNWFTLGDISIWNRS